MINNFLYLLFGCLRFSVPCDFRDKAADLLFKTNFRYGRAENGEKFFSFTVLSFSAKNIRKLFDNNAIPYSESKLMGVPSFLVRYSKRFGLYAGILFFAICVSISQRYVWYIDVKGCETVTEESVLSNLEELGFTYGTNFKKLDFDYLRNMYLKTYDDLCWISINMEGTYAHVEVRELKDPPKTQTTGSANVVASEKGKIVLVESFEGAPVVFPGDHVTAGDLLISGIMTSGEDTLRFERADGRVLAEVERHFKAEIPKTKEEKVYDGEEKYEYSIIFFKKSIKVSGKCRISDKEYDTIIDKEQIILFDSVALPVFIEKTTYRPYFVNTSPMSEKEIMQNKKQLVSERLSEVTADAELLESEIFEYENEDKIIIIGNVKCIADIGEKTDIDVRE